MDICALDMEILHKQCVQLQIQCLLADNSQQRVLNVGSNFWLDVFNNGGDFEPEWRKPHYRSAHLFYKNVRDYVAKTVIVNDNMSCVSQL